MFEGASKNLKIKFISGRDKNVIENLVNNFIQDNTDSIEDIKFTTDSEDSHVTVMIIYHEHIYKDDKIIKDIFSEYMNPPENNE